jgi:hypothetical protein
VPRQSIKIKEILIQGNRGQTGSAKPGLGKERVLEDTGIRDPNRVDNVVALIQSIASKTSLNREQGEITRAITDEFSFYPKNTPFTIEEYKQIIARTAEIAKTLPPDVHMVLATFPVIWPDKGIHNCALYVESPKKPGAEPILHHFSKKYHSTIDFNYVQQNGSMYCLTTDYECTPDQLPDVVLQDTAVATNDVNQHRSALKISTSDGREFFSTIGICLDHSLGVERTDLHHLIDALDAKNEPIPLHCSHVITSASAHEKGANVLSTISHADPSVSYRRPDKYPARRGFVEDKIHSPFSDQLTTEIYPPKLIGALHSDIYQHICANQSKDKLAAELNEKDEDGNTALHRVYLETDYDRDLIAKRLYSMILNGGNIFIKNAQGQSVLNLAFAVDSDRLAYASNKMFRAISAAEAWKDKIIEQNRISAEDGHTPLTRLLAHGQPELEALNKMILNGSNPYVKNKAGQNAFDIIQTYLPLAIRAIIKNELKANVELTQYGYHSAGRSNDSSEDSWFRTPENLEIEESVALPPHSPTYSPIRSAKKFNTILRFMSKNERTTVYEYMADQLPTLIHSSVNEFIDIVRYLSNEQCRSMYNKMKETIPTFINSHNEFHDIMEYLPPEQRTAFFNSMVPKLARMIINGGDKIPIDYMITYCSDEEKYRIKSYVQFIKDLQFPQYMNLLSSWFNQDPNTGPQRTKEAFHSLIAHIQKTKTSIKNPTEALVAALSFFGKSTIKTLFTSLEIPVTDDGLNSQALISTTLNTYILNIGKDITNSYKSAIASEKPSPDTDSPSATRS